MHGLQTRSTQERMHARALSHTHTRARIHTHTHTHTQVLSMLTKVRKLDLRSNKLESNLHIISESAQSKGEGRKEGEKGTAEQKAEIPTRMQKQWDLPAPKNVGPDRHNADGQNSHH